MKVKFNDKTYKLKLVISTEPSVYGFRNYVLDLVISRYIFSLHKELASNKDYKVIISKLEDLTNNDFKLIKFAKIELETYFSKNLSKIKDKHKTEKLLSKFNNDKRVIQID